MKVRALLLFWFLASCRNGTAPSPDAAVNRRPVDAAFFGDAVSLPLAVDFTASACPRFEPGPRCTGPAPLTLEFVPLGTASVTKYLWDFGDGTPKSSAPTPIHTYAFPGTYDVTLVGGGVAGSAPREHLGFVLVLPNGAGDSCDVDQQCEKDLQCICGSTAKCTAAFSRGLCTTPCRHFDCQAGQICADLSLAMAPDAPEVWQQALCLRTCQTDLDCAVGLRCRDLPAQSPAGSWARGCFPGVPAAPGSSCRNAGGQLRNDACLTGQCLDLGANGVCSVDCTRTPCPPGATCADLSDGRHLCLPRCTASFACDRDPLLACAAPNQGPLGFTVAAGSPPGTYCAPKVCSRHEDCGPAGSCRDDLNGAHCVRRAN